LPVISGRGFLRKFKQRRGIFNRLYAGHIRFFNQIEFSIERAYRIDLYSGALSLRNHISRNLISPGCDRKKEKRCMMSGWAGHVSALNSTLQLLSATDGSGKEITCDRAFARWKEASVEIRRKKLTIYLVGNGASASMASHMAADLDKNAHIKTQVFTDFSLLTAVANDLGYEQVFAEPLRRRMIKEDMLVAISSSGMSPNVLLAARDARELGGFVVTLSAMKPGNKLRSLGRINFYLPAETYGMAETCHAAILHFWMDQLQI